MPKHGVGVFVVHGGNKVKLVHEHECDRTPFSQVIGTFHKFCRYSFESSDRYNQVSRSIIQVWHIVTFEPCVMILTLPKMVP